VRSLPSGVTYRRRRSLLSGGVSNQNFSHDVLARTVSDDFARLCPIVCIMPDSECVLFMAALWNRAGHIFALWFLLLSSIFFFISSPNLSGRRVDVYHSSTHALVQI